MNSTVLHDRCTVGSNDANLSFLTQNSPDGMKAEKPSPMAVSMLHAWRIGWP